jgi:putative membrane protein
MVHPWELQTDWEWGLALVVVAVDYAVVVRAYGRRGQPTSPFRIASFTAGLVLIGIALLSPLEHIALTSLLSVHLLQNVILADWAPPLLVLGLSPAMVAAAERRRAIRVLTSPPVALTHRWALGLEHLVFITSGIAFWWPVLTPRRMRAAAKVVYLFGAFVAASPVALALALTHPQYSFYVHAPRLWGLSPLEDQQLGAIAMAIEQAAIMFAACSVCFFRMLAEDDARDAGVGFEA